MKVCHLLLSINLATHEKSERASHYAHTGQSCSDMSSKYLIKLSVTAVKLITRQGYFVLYRTMQVYFGLSRTNFQSIVQDI